jgi:ribosome recycling factor
MMGNNIPNEVIEKTFEQLGEVSDSLKSYFDQLNGKMEQIGEDVTAIRKHINGQIKTSSKENAEISALQ